MGCHGPGYLLSVPFCTTLVQNLECQHYAGCKSEIHTMYILQLTQMKSAEAYNKFGKLVRLHGQLLSQLWGADGLIGGGEVKEPPCAQHTKAALPSISVKCNFPSPLGNLLCRCTHSEDCIILKKKSLDLY